MPYSNGRSTIHGRKFGPQFKFNEAISMFVTCDSQEEVDYFDQAY